MQNIPVNINVCVCRFPVNTCLNTLSFTKNEYICKWWLFLDSVSYVNWMGRWKPLRTDIMTLHVQLNLLLENNWCSQHIVSRTRWFENVVTKVFSSSTINIPANTGPKGEPIVTPSVWTELSRHKVKWTPFVQSRISSFNSCFVKEVLIFFRS